MQGQPLSHGCNFTSLTQDSFLSVSLSLKLLPARWWKCGKTPCETGGGQEKAKLVSNHQFRSHPVLTNI